MEAVNVEQARRLKYLALENQKQRQVVEDLSIGNAIPLALSNILAPPGGISHMIHLQKIRFQYDDRV